MTLRGKTTFMRTIKKYQSTLQNFRPIKNTPSTFTLPESSINMKPSETNQKV